MAVTEDGQQRVELTFAAAAVESLPELVPPDVQEKLIARQIEVAQIAQDALARECPPGELFRLCEAAKVIRVWLE